MFNKTNDTTTHRPLAPGQMLGRYELLAPIATGGMGNVWAARLNGTRGFRKLVAIKTILNPGDDARLEQMLFQEATIASQVHHPNVVETIELGEDQGVMYLVMELIEGESLGFIMREALKRGGVPLPVSVNLIAQVCRGLAAAHELCDEDGNSLGLVHRDVSPPNILVTYSGTVKVVDFGVATTSSSTTLGSGEIKGKISYLAPEQLRGEVLDRRVDIFAAGIVLYQLTVGRHPFKAPSEAQTIARILGDNRPTPPSSWIPGYPEELERVLLRALEKDPEERYANAREFLDALTHAMPEAFAPECESMVADYLHDLLGDRIRQRRASLRVASDSDRATPSSPTASSLPVLLSPPSAPARTRSKAVYALGGMLLAFALVFGFRFASESVTVVRSAAASAPEEIPVSESTPRQETALTGPIIEAAKPSAPETVVAESPSTSSIEVPVSVATAAIAPPARPRPRRERVTSPDETAKPGELDPVALIEAGLSTPDTTADIHIEPERTSAVVEGTQQSTSFVAAVLIPKQAPAITKNAAPRMLASRVGHGRLTIDPSAPAYRVKLPAGLARVQQSLVATVRICVAADGKVTQVNVLNSAGPAVDTQIPEVLSRWRYDPLVEQGRALPFCYVLRYELASR